MKDLSKIFKTIKASTSFDIFGQDLNELVIRCGFFFGSHSMVLTVYTNFCQIAKLNFWLERSYDMKREVRRLDRIVKDYNKIYYRATVHPHLSYELLAVSLGIQQ